MRVDDHIMDFRGLNVHYRVYSPDVPQPERHVLLLNAPLTVPFNWRLILPELIELNCLVAEIDLPGYGASACGRGVPQDPVRRADMVWKILERIDYDQGEFSDYWHLISHGSSCLTLMTLAHEHTESVAGEVFISPMITSPVKPFYRRFPGSRFFPRYYERWFGENIAAESGFKSMLDKHFGRPVPDYVFKRMYRPLLRKGVKEQLLRLAHEGYEHDDELFKGFIPVMVILGQNDPLISAQDAGEIRAVLPDAEIHTLHTAAHFPQETHSKAVCDFLRGWIRYLES